MTAVEEPEEGQKKERTVKVWNDDGTIGRAEVGDLCLDGNWVLSCRRRRGHDGEHWT